MPGLVSRWIDRLSVERQEDEELRSRTRAAGCSSIAETSARTRTEVHGVLTSVTLRPLGDVTALEAELYDGTGSVTLVWWGRRRIEGIRPGRSLTATGRLGTRGTERVIYNPAYRLDAA